MNFYQQTSLRLVKGILKGSGWIPNFNGFEEASIDYGKEYRVLEVRFRMDIS